MSLLALILIGLLIVALLVPYLLRARRNPLDDRLP